MNLCLVANLSLYQLSGVRQALHQLISELLHHDVHLILLIPEENNSLESIDNNNLHKIDSSNLTIESLPIQYFEHSAREMLLFELERIVVSYKIYHLIGLGVQDCAFLLMMLAQLRKIRASPIILFKDVFKFHRNAPYELQSVCEHAHSILTFNSNLLDYLSIFYELKQDAFIVEIEPNLTIDYLNPAREIQHLATPGFVATSGNLSALTDFTNLMHRIKSEMNDRKLSRWVHLGIIEKSVRNSFEEALTQYGIENSFRQINPTSKSDYYHLVKNAACVVRPRGETDTGISIKEFNAWNIPVKVDSSQTELFGRVDQKSKNRIQPSHQFSYFIDHLLK